MTTFEDLHPRAAEGTFTDKTQSAPELGSLTADNTLESEKVGSAREFADRVRHSDPRIAREGAAALLAEVERTVLNLRRKNGLTADQAQDAIGDTIEDLTKRIGNGHSVKGGLIQIAAVAVTSRYVNGPIRHETAKALRILKEEVTKSEAAVGRNLTSREVADLAVKVRTGADFNERHRPVEDFHLIQDFIRPTSFSQFPDSYIDEQMQQFGYDAGSTFEGMGSAADRLTEQLELKETTKSDAQNRLWEVIASDQDLPTATANRVPAAIASDVKAYMKQPDKVLQACRDHEKGVENKNTAALFAPFADLSDSERDRVVTTLLERSDYAQVIWESALYAATAGKSTSSRKSAKKVPVGASA
jgi:hypothetical protein